LALLFVPLLSAAEFNMKLMLDDVNPGVTLSGTPIKVADLKERVVLIEFWGVNCPPCRKSMPDLAKLNTELAPQGFVLIGAHCQEAPDAEVTKLAKSLGANFSITKQTQIRGGDDFSGIPHCVLFDHTGKCVYRGSPFQAEPAIRKAMTAAPPPVLGEHTITKLTALVNLLKKEANIGKALADAKLRVSSPDKKIAEEATFIVEKIHAWGTNRLEAAKAAKDTDPVLAVSLATKVTTHLKGSEPAKAATEYLDELKKNKDFQVELKAAQALVAIKTQHDQLRVPPRRQGRSERC
jgi:thiol-disulfide isomerase/thioredoxin